jgi:hypothetical protein
MSLGEPLEELLPISSRPETKLRASRLVRNQASGKAKVGKMWVIRWESDSASDEDLGESLEKLLHMSISCDKSLDELLGESLLGGLLGK